MTPQLPQEIEHLRIDSIIVADRLRHVDEKAVEELRKSIANVGLLTPISVRVVDEYTSADGEVTDGACLLVAGLHRLEAVRGLGWQKVPSVIVKCDDIDARLMEIAENLHRAELDHQERAEQIEEWRRLTLNKGRNHSDPGGAQPHDKGYSKTAASLGVDEKTVRNAEKIASIAPEAKEAAREAGLTTSQKALLSIARAPQDQQLAKVREIKAAKLADEPLNDFEAKEKQVSALMAAWNKAGLEAREEFLSRIDRPLMDRRYA